MPHFFTYPLTHLLASSLALFHSTWNHHHHHHYHHTYQAGGDSAGLFDVGYDYLNAEQQVGFRAAIYAEGHCGWADRGRYLLLQGSALLWQETMCREWYALLLEPWVHYVPVDYHFGNLRAAAGWALCPANAPAVRAMLRRLATYADAVLSRATAVAYAAALMERYADLWTPAAELELQERQEQEPQPLPPFGGCPSEPAGDYLERTRPFEGYSDDT